MADHELTDRTASTPMPKDGSHTSPSSDGGQVSRKAGLRQAIGFVEAILLEFEGVAENDDPNPRLRIAAHVVAAHLDGRIVTPTAAVAAAGIPYATATRRLSDMIEEGLIERRPRTATGKSFTLHPSDRLIERWAQLSDRLPRIASGWLSGGEDTHDYYFGGSYRASQVIGAVTVLHQPLQLSGGLKVLVHGDPTFMVMDNLKRQLEQVIGCPIQQRAFSIDRLRHEALRNAERKQSQYDIIAVDLPWIGEFAAKGLLTPLDDLFDTERLDPSDFHTAGWKAAHWSGRPYAVPSQTTPELLFYRTDVFAKKGLAPPRTISQLLLAAETLHEPRAGRYGIAWNASRGTALGHTFLMACADFGQPVLDLPKVAGGFGAMSLADRISRPLFDRPKAQEAAEFLLELMRFSPPDILSMSWFERIRPYAAGKVAMAYGYTLLAPYFELDDASPAHGNTGYLPHPAAEGASNVAPVGGYVLGIPANLPRDRRDAAVEALVTFTAPEAQKLFVMSGSRTQPRYSIGADPEVRRLSPIFEAVDAMSWRDELQFWPRPPVPAINDIIQASGEELHDMLRGAVKPREALTRIQRRAEAALEVKFD